MSKSLDKLQEWIPHITTKNKDHINIVQRRVVFEFIWNIKLNSKYLNCVKNFTGISNTSFKIHVSNLIAIDFIMLINSQLTTMAHTVSPWITASTKTSDHASRALSKVSGRLRMLNVLTGINIGLIKCLIFKRRWKYWAFSASLQIKDLLKNVV